MSKLHTHISDCNPCSDELLPPVDWRAFHKRHLPVWDGRRTWWVYFIQGEDGGPIKIGRTRNLAARVSELQCGYPFGRLRYVAIVHATDQTEQYLHEQFASFRLFGEWFVPAPELVRFIRQEITMEEAR